ncbi:hypothetical protein GCM10027347_37770 [Larkinella harenae]
MQAYMGIEKQRIISNARGMPNGLSTENTVKIAVPLTSNEKGNESQNER